MSVGKASIRRAASAGVRKTAAKAEVKAAEESVVEEIPKKEVVQSVISPMNAEEIQVKFLSSKEMEVPDKNRPVRITEAMPSYLL